MIQLVLFKYVLLFAHLSIIQALIHQIPISFFGGFSHLFIRAGNPSYHYNTVLLDISSQYTYLHLTMGIFSISQSVEVIHPICSLTLNNTTSIKSIEISDILYIGDNSDLTLNDIIFYLIESEKDNNYSFEKVGLAFKLEHNSFISQLKNKGLILSLAFSFVNLTSNQAMLYLGGIPPNITKSKYHSECKVKKESIEWSCSLNSVIINQTIFHIKAYAYFSSVILAIYTPEKFLNELYDIYFKPAFKQKQCYLNLKTDQKYTIACEKDYINNIPNITFLIDNYLYSFISNQLFDCNYFLCNFLLVPNPDAEQWVFGFTFLRHFDVLFDHDRESITFYSDNLIEKYHLTNSKKAFALIVLIFIGVLGIGYILINKYKMLQIIH